MKKILVALFVMLSWGGLSVEAHAGPAGAPDQGVAIVLEDFAHYPEGWTARSGMEKAGEVYQAVHDETGSFLHGYAETTSIRIFKKIGWDSKVYPIVEWKWRVKKWPGSGPARIFMYVSLDKDFFGIPTIVKYAWSKNPAVESESKGGLFRPAELIVRNGAADGDGWITERVNARTDFRKVAGREPRGAAYGIGILADPGIEIEIGEVRAVRE